MTNPLIPQLREGEGADRCSWCNTDPVEAAARFEGPHATWCVHYRFPRKPIALITAKEAEHGR